MKAIHFDIDRIVYMVIHDKFPTSFTWLPRKQKTVFFGLFETKNYYEEGFYRYGMYQEGFMEYTMDATPYSREDLEKCDYIVDDDLTVWNKPYVTIYLTHDRSISHKFNTIEELENWVNQIITKTDKKFEVLYKSYN